MKKVLLLILVVNYSLHSGYSVSANIDVQKILIPASVDQSNIAMFNSPIVTYNNNIYVAFVEVNGENKLSTRVGKYSNSKNWTFSTVEPDTMNNPYHAQPSIAVDTSGFIHITYNMHSSPWQYSVSEKAEDISKWKFEGQNLKGPHGDLKSAAVTGIGTASIPGNRITYHYMAVDRKGAIYISFREALKNRRGIKYGDRQWSLGLVKYDVSSKQWNRVGNGNIKLPFATEPGFRPQVAHMSFDHDNNMHISWNWYVEYSLDGSNKKNVISYAYSSDDGKTFQTTTGDKLELPMRRFASEKIVDADYYESYTKISATTDGLPVVLIMPQNRSGKKRSLVRYAKNSGWMKPLTLPYGATDFYIDKSNVYTAISSGLRIHRSIDKGVSWETIDIDTGEGPYNIWLDRAYINSTDNLRFLAQSKKSNKLYIYTLKYKDSNTLAKLSY